MSVKSLFFGLLLVSPSLLSSQILLNNFGTKSVSITIYEQAGPVFRRDIDAFGGDVSFNTTKPLVYVSYRDRENNKQYRFDFPQGKRLARIIFGENGWYKLQFVNGEELQGDARETR